MLAKTCDSCGSPIVFLKTDKFKPDGKPKWAACNPENVDEDDTVYDWKRHKNHFLTCMGASAVKYREDYARKKAEQNSTPAVDTSAEIEF